MAESDIKEYLSRIGIRRIRELDTALIETFGAEEGEKHIENLTSLFDQAEERLLIGARKGESPFPRRQKALVDYLNQSLEMSLLASSFYDSIFFRRVMEYLSDIEKYFGTEIVDIGCGNGILTNYIALQYTNTRITGLDLSENALLVAQKIAGNLNLSNTTYCKTDFPEKKQCDTLFSCRTFHENVPWSPMRKDNKTPAKSNSIRSPEQLSHLHEDYARKLAVLVRPGGFLISIERYDNDLTYAGLLSALEKAGFRTEKGTHMQFSCKNGDESATFQTNVFQLCS